jgi:hypothetical protein
MLGLLLILSPSAMAFAPSAAIYRDGVWAKTYVHDDSYQLRETFIVFGLAAGALSLVAGLRSIRRDRSCSLIITTGSVLAACLTLGWCLYPYWINGVYQAYSGGAPLRDLDPKALPPMIWIGEVWRLSALIVWGVGTAAQFAALVSSVWISGSAWHRTRWFWVVGTTAFVHLVCVFRFSPSYLKWLLD